MMGNFDEDFETLTGKRPFPWQRALFARMRENDIPAMCDIPTGLGKTSVIAVWLLARSETHVLPTRLVYVVNRRTVVDQTTVEVERIRVRLETPQAAPIRARLIGAEPEPISEQIAGQQRRELLAISTLRGQMADNRAWSEDPSRVAVISGTVDMIGSRLLFSGYRIGFKSKPLHAGFLAQDALLVHDEAHLEPSFQILLDSMVTEQERCDEQRWKLRVMALTATQRTPKAGLARKPQETFRLGGDDYAHPLVKQRIEASKQLTLHVVGANELVDKVVAQVATYKESGRAVLVFLRTVDDVRKTAERLGKAGMTCGRLTGTMRGYERDRLVTRSPVFNRFLPPEDRKIAAKGGTVVLLCTSAGEVGVNLSADHLVCDLSTFDAMAQRFGRVNRFGDHVDSEVHVFHLAAEVMESDDTPWEQARLATLALLRRLDGDASPKSLGEFGADERSAAFAPAPDTLPATDILFDKWAMTSIRGALPGRPPVSAYLHGVPDDWEPPVAQVAWRTEVDLISADLVDKHLEQNPRDDLRADLLEDYPLKPHEMLSDRTRRIVDTLLEVADRYPTAHAAPIWIVEENGEVRVQTLGRLLDGDRKRLEGSLAGRTLLLSPKHSHPEDGLLTIDGWRPDESTEAMEAAAVAEATPLRTVKRAGGRDAGGPGTPVDTAPASGATPAPDEVLVPDGAPTPVADSTSVPDRADVADLWLDDKGLPRRARVFDDTKPPDGLRWIRTVVLRDDDDGDETSVPAGPARWRWYECPRGADDDGSRSGAHAVRLDVHSGDVKSHAARIVKRLSRLLHPGEQRAIVLASEHHDYGKRRRLWQLSIGNRDRELLLAKSGPKMRPLELTRYRHELGSMLDAERDLLSELTAEDRELALHLIAAHHGRARPHFPDDELFDPEARGVDVRAEGVRVMQRFARLQRRYGRWGLAYLESLVRAADYAASAAPSEVVEGPR